MATSTFDTLVDALSVEIEAFAICEIARDVALIIPAADGIEVHHVLAGTLHLTIDQHEPIEVGPGAMLIVPPGRSQRLAASPASRTDKLSSEVCLPVRDGMVVVDATDGRPPVLRVACGTVLPNSYGTYGPLDGLAQPIAENLSDVAIVAAAFAAMLEEAAAPVEGTMALTSALMKACLVVLLRRHLRRSRETGIPPSLFDDSRIGRAIAMVLDRPAGDHSVTSMAKEAGMSRSAFARDFKTKLHMTPIEFVARVRLDIGRRLLFSTGHSVTEISATVGFASRSHFSRLFRERFGLDPTRYRRQRGTD